MTTDTNRPATASGSWFEAVVERADAAVLVVGDDDAVIHANPRASELLDARPGSPSQPVRDVLGALVVPGGQCRSAELRDHPISLDLTLRRSSGETLILSVGATAIADAAGRPATLLVGRDVTPLVLRHRRLAQTQHLLAMADLARSMAHEFNNMHQGIVALASVVLDSLPPDHASREDMEQILVTTRRGEVLSRDLVGFSDLSSGRMPTIDLGALVGEVAVRARTAAGEDRRVVFVPAASPVPVRAVRELLESLLDRLCADALRAMPGGGRLELQLRVGEVDEAFREEHMLGWSGPFAQIEIRDTGPGMDDASSHRRFEPRVSSDADEGAVPRDLSRAWGLVRAFLGTMTLQSEPGLGTCIRLHLPTNWEEEEE